MTLHSSTLRATPFLTSLLALFLFHRHRFPPPLFEITFARRRVYTYADGFKPRRRHEQPSAIYTFSRNGDFSSRRWHEHSSRGHERAAHPSANQQQQQTLQRPRVRSFQENSVNTQRNEGVPPTGKGDWSNGGIRVGEAWSESVVGPEGGSQRPEGVSATGTGQQRPGKERWYLGCWEGSTYIRGTRKREEVTCLESSAAKFPSFSKPAACVRFPHHGEENVGFSL